MSVQHVVFAVNVLNFTGSNFAIRGGGHSPFEGWANIDEAVLISMSNVTDIKYDATSETVTVGAGNRWADVYRGLETSGRMVLGGRVPDVGMGLLLGGEHSLICARMHGSLALYYRRPFSSVE